MKVQEGAILIIDDDKADQLIVKEAFNSLEIKNELIFMESVTDAMNFLLNKSENIFLIISDMHLHLEDGIKLKLGINEVEEIKKKSIPFIFMSNTASQEEVQIAYEAGVQGYFNKGYNLEETLKNLAIIINYWKNCRHPSNRDLI